MHAYKWKRILSVFFFIGFTKIWQDVFDKRTDIICLSFKLPPRKHPRRRAHPMTEAGQCVQGHKQATRADRYGHVGEGTNSWRTGKMTAADGEVETVGDLKTKNRRTGRSMCRRSLPRARSCLWVPIYVLHPVHCKNTLAARRHKVYTRTKVIVVSSGIISLPYCT